MKQRRKITVMYKADAYFTPSKGLNIRDEHGHVVEVITGDSAKGIAEKANERLRQLNTPPLLLVQDNKVIGTATAERKPMYENEMCKAAGLIASRNSCDRVIFEDENDLHGYQQSGGYCADCRAEL